MYTYKSPILYSEEPRGECISGQHPKCLHIPLRSKAQCQQVFVVVAFPPPPVTSPATRLMPKHKRHRSHLAVPFQMVLLVFIRTARKALRPFLASLSASIQGVIAANFRLSPLSDNASPPSSASPCTGQMPVSNFDCKSDFTRVFLVVKQKIL